MKERETFFGFKFNLSIDLLQYDKSIQQYEFKGGREMIDSKSDTKDICAQLRNRQQTSDSIKQHTERHKCVGYSTMNWNWHTLRAKARISITVYEWILPAKKQSLSLVVYDNSIIKSFVFAFYGEEVGKTRVNEDPLVRIVVN